MNIASATRLPVNELTTALAIHCALHGFDAKGAARQLDPMARACFEVARPWAQANGDVIALCESDPAAVRAGQYTLSSGRSWLARLFGVGKKTAPPSEAEMQQIAQSSGRSSARGPARPIDEDKRRRMEALRALVDESLDG